MKSIVLSLLLVAQLTFALPGAPTTSINNLRTIKSRQAKSKDVVRRLRDGPGRKRAEPSAPVCSDNNLLINGDFQTQTSSPWIINPGSAGRGFVSDGFAYQDASDVNGHWSFGYHPLATVCSSKSYYLSYRLGNFQYSGTICPITVSIGTYSHTHANVCPPGDVTCTASGNSYYAPFRVEELTFASNGAQTLQVTVDCIGNPSGSHSNFYLADSFVLATEV